MTLEIMQYRGETSFTVTGALVRKLVTTKALGDLTHITSHLGFVARVEMSGDKKVPDPEALTYRVLVTADRTEWLHEQLHAWFTTHSLKDEDVHEETAAA